MRLIVPIKGIKMISNLWYIGGKNHRYSKPFSLFENNEIV